ncbi:MAG: amino acid adenylation domain-containing protein [Cyanobacteria bacterium P01_H01_bin.15]
MASFRDRLSQLSPEQRRQLAQKLRQKQSQIAPRPTGEKAALSFAQQRMWLLYRLESDSAAYNRPCFLSFQGDLKIDVLERALNEILRRHEVLRSRFPEVNGEPTVEIIEDFQLALERINLRSLSSPEQQHRVQELATQEAKKTFDITQDCLVRGQLLILGDRQYVLLLTFHHIIFDGWSEGLFIQELETLIDAFLNRHSSPLANLPIQYADFSHWERRWLTGERAQKQIKYWRQKLAGQPAQLGLPTDHPRPAIKTNNGDRIYWSLDSESTHQLREFSQRHGCTLFMTLLAAFQVLLFRYSGQTDISVGTPIANRTRPETESLIGYFANALVLRCHLSSDITFDTLLLQLRETAVDAYRHQDIPFDQLVYELQPPRDPSVTPLFQILFGLQPKTKTTIYWQSLDFNTGTAKFDLEINLKDEQEKLRGFWQYNTDLFERSTIEKLTAHYKYLLSEILSSDGDRIPIKKIPLLSQTQAFSCYLIGQGSFLLPCAQYLQQQGHIIHGIISENMPELNIWSESQGIPLISAEEDIVEFLSQESFDYLFSIFNLKILSSEVLKLPKRGAINFHDGPLPKYAGIYAPTWAIYNGETQYGITWHLMEAGIDTGEILQQEIFSVEPNETALSLNLKCYQAAIKSFKTLTHKLILPNLELTSQEVEKRTYYSLIQRPCPGNLVCWNMPVAQVDRLIRCLDFGSSSSVLGYPKLFIEGTFYAILEAHTREHSVGVVPGTVISVSSEKIQIALFDGSLEIDQISTLEGSDVPFSTAISLHHLRSGRELSSYASDLLTNLGDTERRLFSHEPYWISQLQSWEPTIFPTQQSFKIPAVENLVRFQLNLQQTVIHQIIVQNLAESPQDFLTWSFAVYLSRLLEVNTVCLGFDIGAGNPNILSDFFATCVPLRWSIDSQQSGEMNWNEGKKQLAALRQHQTYARDLICKQSELQPLQVGIGITTGLSLAELTLIENSQLTVAFSPDLHYVWVVSDPKVLEPITTEAVFKEYLYFLSALLHNFKQPLATLPLVENDRIAPIECKVEHSEELNDAQISCLHHLFEKYVSIQPDKPAVIAPDGHSLTYQQLNDLADRLASYLQRENLSHHQSRVGVHLPRSLDAIASILGILKAGATYVPLDPEYPAERRKYMISHTDMSCVITHRGYSLPVTSQNVRPIYLDQLWDLLPPQNQSFTASSDPDAPAYMIYTSGSTGQPKGVVIPHRAAVNFVNVATDVYNITQDDRVLQFTSLCFDTSIEEFFSFLAAGGTVVLRNEAILSSATALIDYCRQWSITVLDFPTAYWQTMLNDLVTAQPLPDSVRLIIVGGEAMNLFSAQQWQTTYGNHPKLINSYGPTEATVACLFYDVDSDIHDRMTVPIGRPTKGMQVYLCNKSLQPVPPGVPGEICIAGKQLAQGYWNAPQKTEQSFVLAPFNPTVRLYRTGDLGRCLSDGNIEYLGREDSQIKIRGFRVELGEIEVQLMSMPEVENALIILREDEPGNKQLVAYVILGYDNSDAIAKIKHELTALVPSYMLPNSFVVLKKFPLTPNGKVDKRALPAPEYQGTAKLVPAQDELEKQLVKIWEQVLNKRPIGVQDNFFDLGGHSLLAVKLFAEIEKRFGRTLPLATLFQAGTIAKLATVIRSENWLSPSSLVPIQTSGSKVPLFFCPPAGGHSLIYQALARHLGPEQPIYALEIRGADGSLNLNTSLEERVQLYIKLVCQVQPQGPYTLLGLSSGGLTAWAMAHKLELQGDQVALLTLIDTSNPKKTRIMPLLPRFLSVARWYIVDRVAAKIRYIKRKYFRQEISQAKQVSRINTPETKKQRQIKRRRRENAFRANLQTRAKKNWLYYLDLWSFDWLLRSSHPQYARWLYGKKTYLDDIVQDELSSELFELLQKNLNELQSYELSVINAPVLIFRASIRPPAHLEAPQMGWRSLTISRIDIITITGEHQDIVRSQDLAHHLKRFLDRS